MPARKKFWVGKGARPLMSRVKRATTNAALDQRARTANKNIGHLDHLRVYPSSNNARAQATIGTWP